MDAKTTVERTDSDDILASWPGEAEETPETEEEAAEETDEEVEAENDEAEDEPEDEGDDEAEESDEDEDDSDDDDEEETKSSDEPDEVAAKRIAQIQAEETRARKAIAAEREQLAAERAEHKQALSDLAEFKSLRARAKFEPVNVLLALGLTEEDFEPAAQQLYALSPDGKSDPKRRAQVERLQQQRALTAEIEALKANNEKLVQRLDEREARQEQERAVQEYSQRIERAINGQTPIVSALLANKPDYARARLIQTAHALAERNGEVPDPAEVVAELERDRAEELKAIGIEPPRAGKKQKARTKTKTKTKAKTKADSSKETTPPSNSIPTREELLAEKWPDE